MDEGTFWWRVQLGHCAQSKSKLYRCMSSQHYCYWQPKLKLLFLCTLYSVSLLYNESVCLDDNDGSSHESQCIITWKIVDSSICLASKLRVVLRILRKMEVCYHMEDSRFQYLHGCKVPSVIQNFKEMKERMLCRPLMHWNKRVMNIGKSKQKDLGEKPNYQAMMMFLV